MVSFGVGKNKVNIINRELRNLGEILKSFILESFNFSLKSTITLRMKKT